VRKIAPLILALCHRQEPIVPSLPASLSFPLPFLSPGIGGARDTRADAATARLVEQALATQREAGGDLGFFAAYRQLAEHKIADSLAFDVLGRDAWRR
jgi:hypothetical protein